MKTIGNKTESFKAPLIVCHYNLSELAYFQEITDLNHSPIIFIAGMPRSGSMWTYNVCRRLITAVGKTPWPDEVPLDESPAIQHALSHPPASGQVYCIKTHFQIPVGKPHMRIICNYRDIRDATLSYMRFMKCTFEQALAAARGGMQLTDHYLESQDPNVLPIPYDMMINQPQQTISTLAGFLSIPVEAAEIENIAQSLSREAVARQLEKLKTDRQDIENSNKDSLALGKLSSVPNLDGSSRLHDSSTGFQTNHISSNKDGEWRKAFSSEEQEKLMAVASDWLLRYNFIP